MKFKIYFNEQVKEMQISFINDSYNDVILPKNTHQHIYFPIPKELQSRVRGKLKNIVPQDFVKDFLQIQEDIKLLNKKSPNIMEKLRILQQTRNDLIHSIRKEYNPKIMKALKQFQLDFAEFYL